MARREFFTQPDNFYVVWYNSTTQDLFLVFSLKNAIRYVFAILRFAFNFLIVDRGPLFQISPNDSINSSNAYYKMKNFEFEAL
jgi:hypothetical protein